MLNVRTSCRVCGKSFRTSRAHALFCSPACRQKNYRQGRAKKKNGEQETVTMKQLEMLAVLHGF